jgi:hypothetical protein
MRTITLSIEGAGDETCERCPWRRWVDGQPECRVWHHGVISYGRRWPECLSAEGRPEPGPRVTMTPLGECLR